MSSADTTVSAYDMLSNEDREALDWVRDHGGLDALRSEMPVISYRASLVGSVYDALDIDPDEPGAAMMLASEVKRLRDDHDALLWMDERGGLDAVKARLMPEGMSWPRFEDGEPVRIRDEVPLVSDTMDVTSVELSKGRFILHGWGYEIGCNCQVKYRSGERVKRLKPKVTDADGVEIRVDTDVWWVCEGDERGIHAEAMHVIGFDEDGLVECAPHNGGTWVYLNPSELHVEKPVLSADGRPLREGDEVYLLPGKHCDRFPLHLYHAWDEMEVKDLNPSHSVPGVVACRGDGNAMCYPKPSQITHERPGIWERLVDSIVRRASALAERWQ